MTVKELTERVQLLEHRIEELENSPIPIPPAHIPFTTPAGYIDPRWLKYLQAL